MVNDIIKGISLKLNSVFGDGYRIYSEDVTQGLKKPCFFIALISPTVTPMLGSRKFRRNSFDIHYFPKDGREEIQDVAEQLIEGLEYIVLPAGDMLHGTGMSYEIVDGVLHFSASYNLLTIGVDAHEAMEDIEYGTLIIGG